MEKNPWIVPLPSGVGIRIGGIILTDQEFVNLVRSRKKEFSLKRGDITLNVRKEKQENGIRVVIESPQLKWMVEDFITDVEVEKFHDTVRILPLRYPC